MVENGRGHNSAKNQYFFDLVSNIAISSKSTDTLFFYSFEKLFFLGAWVLNNFFSGNFFQKWSIFAVIRLFHPEGGQLRKIYLVRHGGKWGLRIEWNRFGHRISLGSCARSILSNFFWECILKLIYHLVGEPNGDYVAIQLEDLRYCRRNTDVNAA